MFLIRVDHDSSERMLGSRSELADALHKAFGFDIDDFRGDALDDLWTRSRSTHGTHLHSQSQSEA